MKIHRERNPSTLAVFLAVAAVVGYSSTADAQDVTCRATKSSDGLFVGRCVQGDSSAGDITFRRPALSAPDLWLGTIRGARFRSAASGGLVGESEIGLDVREGVLSLGRSWLSVGDTRTDGDELSFVFRFDHAAPASDVDVRILEKARAMLADESQWNRKDSTDMGAAPVKGFSCAPANRQSMFCAVYLASLEIGGDYFHFRPAVNALRQAVNDSSERRYRHPLIDFNNDESVTLADVHGVLDAALAAVRAAVSAKSSRSSPERGIRAVGRRTGIRHQ